MRRARRGAPDSVSLASPPHQLIRHAVVDDHNRLTCQTTHGRQNDDDDDDDDRIGWLATSSRPRARRTSDDASNANTTKSSANRLLNHESNSVARSVLVGAKHSRRPARTGLATPPDGDVARRAAHELKLGLLGARQNAALVVGHVAVSLQLVDAKPRLPVRSERDEPESESMPTRTKANATDTATQATQAFVSLEIAKHLHRDRRLAQVALLHLRQHDARDLVLAKQLGRRIADLRFRPLDHCERMSRRRRRQRRRACVAVRRAFVDRPLAPVFAARRLRSLGAAAAALGFARRVVARLCAPIAIAPAHTAKSRERKAQRRRGSARSEDAKLMS